MKKTQPTNIGINIGTDAATVKAAGDKVLDILEIGYQCSMDQETIRTALCQFSEAVSVENASVMNCSISMGGDK